VKFGAVYVSPESAALVDFYFAVCPNPRIFEWNLMHHQMLQSACVDLDGVLCCDPTPADNDDGIRYLEFVRNAKPLFIPTAPVGHVVTCRLEKYRAETVAWLARHNVRYNRLVMMQYATAAERVKAGRHAEYKAEVCRSANASLFIESDQRQAGEIARLANVDVFCVGTRSMVRPSEAGRAIEAVTRAPWRTAGLIRRAVKAAKRRLIAGD